MENKKIVTFDGRFWLFLAIFTIIICWICTFPVWFTSNSDKYDFRNTGPIGDTIGGTMGPFVAIAAAILTFLAFWVQYKANEQQKQDIQEQKEKSSIEGIETRFMEMVKMHRDNVRELSFTTYSKEKKSKNEKENLNKHTAQSRKVFKEIFYQFKLLNKEMFHFFDKAIPEDIYENVYLVNLLISYPIKEREIDLVLLAKIDILYCIVYFGLGSDDSATIEDFFNHRYKPKFYKPLLFHASLKPKQESDYWEKWQNYNNLPNTEKMNYLDYWGADSGRKDEFSFEEVANVLAGNQNFYHDLPSTDNYFKYYGGHQFRLGHYFRHLYQTVNFIDKSKLLSFEEKYENIKLLRGQLSTYEQIIFFLNSISILGRVWELEPKINLADNEKHKNRLVTRYNLIKNIAKNEVVDGIFVADFYPLVSYEANFKPDLNEQRKTLQQKYKAEKSEPS